VNQPDSERPLAGARRAGTSEHVLVVDDEPVVRNLTARLLATAGYRTASAADGAEALELIRRRPGSFDAVVSDIVMPRLNGVDLLSALATVYPYVPVVLMSGYFPEQLAARGIVAPCHLLPKPYQPEQMLEAVRRCIDASRVPASLSSASQAAPH